MELKDFYSHNDKELCKLITLVASCKIKKPKANYFKTNGILVRLGLLRRSFDFFIPALDKLPKNDYECETVNLMLNSIYLHLRGILDNTAWLIYYELDLQNLRIPRDIDFAGDKYQKSLFLYPKLAQTIKLFLLWMAELKQKRDPIAHRLPLYIPPKFIDNEDDLKKAFELKEKAKEKLKNNDDSWMDDEVIAMNLGNYKPIILNMDIDKEICNSYPILPEMKKDIETFASFITQIFTILKN